MEISWPKSQVNFMLHSSLFFALNKIADICKFVDQQHACCYIQVQYLIVGNSTKIFYYSSRIIAIDKSEVFLFLFNPSWSKTPGSED